MAESFTNEYSSTNELDQSESFNNVAESVCSGRLDVVDLLTNNDDTSGSLSPIRDEKNGLLPIDLCSGLDEHRVLHQLPPEIISTTELCSVRERTGSSSTTSASNRRLSGIDSSEATRANTHSCKYSDMYPLHWLVWHNDLQELGEELRKDTMNLELRDPRGRTPLLLAVTLGHLEATSLLLRKGCSTQADMQQGWTVVQEAVSCGDPELVSAVLRGRDCERHSSRALGIPHLLQKLAQAPDFYVEMKWEFTSWVPLVSRMCPSDTYRVFKRGSSVRIDTTLLGFHDSQWLRGSRSYIFRGQGDSAVLYEVDHDKEVVYMEQMQSGGAEGAADPADSLIAHRLTSPNVATSIDTDKISFERDKSGIWGWRADKSELINGHNCKVFSASNVEIVTRTRTEHLSTSDKEQSAGQRSPLHAFFALAEDATQAPVSQPQDGFPADQPACNYNPSSISPHQYFDESVDLGDRDVGRPKEMATKSQRFKAVLWLAEQYPLRLQEQVMPIVDLMAISSTHFAKLQHFIQMQLPSGFPVKIEIPLFHVLTARITFGNIFGLDAGVEGVTSVEEGDRLSCVLDRNIFDPPQHYSMIGGSEPHLGRSLALEEDDALLQFALHQSLVGGGQQGGTMDVWEALQQEQGKGDSDWSPPVPPAGPDRSSLLYAAQTAEQTDLQRAIENSLLLAQTSGSAGVTSPDVVAPTLPAAAPSAPTSTITTTTTTTTTTAAVSTPCSISTASSDSSERTTDWSVASDADFALAVALSKRQLGDDEQRRLEQEEDQLQRILQLSLSEK